MHTDLAEQQGFTAFAPRGSKLRSHCRLDGNEQQSTGLLQLTVRIPIDVKNPNTPNGVLGFLAEEKGFETLRSVHRRAGERQQSTGLLHLMVQIPSTIKKEHIPMGCVLFYGGGEGI